MTATLAPTRPFTPKGEVAEWEKVYAVLVRMDVGDVVTYQQLDAILGRDFRSARTPFYAAAKRLLQEKQRACAVVPTVGYQVVDAKDHEPLARKQHRGARRKLGKARALISRADRSRLTPEERERFDRLELTLSRQADMVRRLDARVAKTEHEIKTTRLETDERVTKLEDALRRHGIEVGAPA
jgi:uncharacterized coiled-coil protein SlyX